MKLHRLELEGVGSFADHMRVDFEALTNAGLFLIEGPTGSGKSTILDAIVFALYGSVAGSGSDLGRLDSHLRTGSPWVELEFEVGNAVYRVRRSPAHQRAKKRGDGTTPVTTSVSLMELTAEGPITLGTRASEVADYIHAIIGLNKPQFVSTVVLAQGEFATFLDAGTGDRTQILERIFGTEFYQRVEEQLHQMRRQARVRRSEATAAVTEMVDQCKGILDVDFGDADPLSDVDVALTEVRSDLRAARDVAERADGERVRSEQVLQAARKLHSDQGRKRVTQVRHADLAARREQTEKWRSAVQAHQRSIPLVPSIGAWQRAVEAIGAAESAVAACRGVLGELGESPDPDARRQQHVVGLIGALEHAVRLEQGLQQQGTHVEGLRIDSEHAGVALRESQERLTRVEVDIAQATTDLQQRPDASESVLELSRRVETLEKLRDLWGRLSGMRDELQSAQSLAQSAHSAWVVADDDVRAAQEALLRDHAGQLAAGLVDDQPCAVCGSRTHPAPARPATSPGADIHALRKVADQRRAAAMASDRTVSQLAGVVEELLSQAGDTDDARVREQLDTVGEELGRAREHQSQRAGLVQQLQGLAADKEVATDDLTEARLSQQLCASELEAATAAFDAAQASVVEARAEHPSVSQRVVALEQVRDAQAAAIAAEATAHGRAEEHARAASVMEQTLQRAGFPDVETAQAGVLTDDEVERFLQGVETWETESAEVSAILRDLEDIDLETDPEVSTLEVRSVEAGAHAKSADGQVTRLADRIARAAPRREELRVRLDHRDHVRLVTEPVIRMADLATAQRHEVIHRVRLSSFVLMRRFEDVVRAANDRLDTISEGRYQLVVVGSGLDARSQAGLDLRIYDGRSDSQRSTKSLSGGERFYVSLALALGLADVVRAESGGVELGTLFIDEGFGSLDADVLEEVMDMLEQVRVGEDRVIGLISHVEVLKSRIDPRISVRRDPARPGVSTLEVRA